MSTKGLKLFLWYAGDAFPQTTCCCLRRTSCLRFAAFISVKISCNCAFRYLILNILELEQDPRCPFSVDSFAKTSVTGEVCLAIEFVQRRERFWVACLNSANKLSESSVCTEAVTFCTLELALRFSSAPSVGSSPWEYVGT